MGSLAVYALVSSTRSPLQSKSPLTHTNGWAVAQRWQRAWSGTLWSQALINGHWHDLDATLDVPFHGGHILTSTSSMVDILSLRSSELTIGDDEANWGFGGDSR